MIATQPEKVTPLQAWHTVVSLKLHFEGKLDAVKYRFRMSRLTQKSLDARRDKYQYEKLARRHPDPREAIWFVASNIMAGNTWVGTMNEEPWMSLKAYHESMEYRFREELKSALASHGSLDSMLISRDSSPPILLKAHVASQASIHLLGILQVLTGFLTHELRGISDPLGLWTEQAVRAKAYARLLETEIHVPTYRDLVIKACTS